MICVFIYVYIIIHMTIYNFESAKRSLFYAKEEPLLCFALFCKNEKNQLNERK